MRTSLNETRLIEKYLLNLSRSREEQRKLERIIQADSGLAKKVQFQERAYQLIKQFGRKLFKKELNTIHQTLTNSPEHTQFQKTVKEIFYS